MAEQLKRGPHAVIECTEEIPCNPCCTACPLVEAILMAELGHLPPAEEYPSTRPPVRPMPLSALLAGEEDT